jgi:hypothetical protein
MILSVKKQRCVLSLAIGLVLATSCSGGSEAARVALLKAAEQTTSAESFHFASEFRAPDGTQEGEGDYVAPDRFRMQGFGEGAAMSIHIGRDSYVTGPENLSRFFHYEEPCDLGIEGFFPALTVIELADEVDLAGDTYLFSVDGEGDPEGAARIEDGYIVSLVLRYDLAMIGEVEERHSLSGFNSDIRVEPPPASQVEDIPMHDGVLAVDGGPGPDCSQVWEPSG